MNNNISFSLSLQKMLEKKYTLKQLWPMINPMARQISGKGGRFNKF